jgi:hypothetical protein
MKKEELLKLLDHAYNSEEALTLKMKNIMLLQTLLSAIPQENKKEMRKILEMLYNQSLKHAEIVGSWRLKVLRGEVDDY